MLTNKDYYIAAILACLTFLSFFADPVVTTQYIKETKEDVEEALANKPIQYGAPVNTIVGKQLVPGALPVDLSINREIFNDIADIRAHMIELMQMVTNFGARYNMAADSQLLKYRLETILAEIENALKIKLVQ